jgi:Universal stress protein UspA and related nucleotide-binding proteins
VFKSIVVGTDGSATAREAVRTASKLAQLAQADLHVVSAYRLPEIGGTLTIPCSDEEIRAGVEAMLASLAEEIADEGVVVTTHASPERAAAGILAVAEAVHADLIVVGNRGMQGMGRFLGSVPNNIAHHAGCAVLIVHTC